MAPGVSVAHNHHHHQNQQNGHQPAAGLLNASLHAIIAMKAVTHERKELNTTEPGEVMKLVK